MGSVCNPTAGARGGMNNVRDAPPQPETFPKEQERAPVAGSIPLGGGGNTTLQGTAQSAVTTPKPDPTASPCLGARCALCWGISLFLQPAWRRTKPREPFEPAKPNRGTKGEETILQSPRHVLPRHRSTAKGNAAEEEPNTRPNPTALLGSREKPGTHLGTPHATPRHTTHIARACRVPCVPTHSWRGGLPVPHVCPTTVLAACLHTHVPRRRVTASNVNARAGLLWLQVHESLSSGGGNLLPRTDHLRAAAGPVRAGAAPAPPPHSGYLGRPKGGAAAASSCAAAGGTQEPAALSGPNPLASSRTRRAPRLAPHGQGKPPHSRDTAQGSPCPTTAAWGCATAGCRKGREILATGIPLCPP